MTSDRKIAANRRNGAKSRGPRTAAGRKTASRNALRHGLAAIAYRPAFPSSHIDRFAQGTCGDDSDPALLVAARAIVENELELQLIQKHEIAVVERLRDEMAFAFAKDRSGVKPAKLRLQQETDAYNELMTELPKVLAKYKDQLPENPKVGSTEFVPVELELLLEEEDEPPVPTDLKYMAARSAAVCDNSIRKRDEAEALEAAVLDLIRLDRYHRRAWSRQKRALLNFINIKLARRLAASVSIQ